MACYGEQRTLWDAAHVLVPAVTQGRPEPEPSVVVEVAIALHRHDPPSRADADVCLPRRQMPMRRRPSRRCSSSIRRQVETDDDCVPVDLTTLSCAEQRATRADDCAALVLAHTRIRQGFEHVRGTGRSAERSEALWWVEAAQLAEVCMLHQRGRRAVGRRRTDAARALARWRDSVVIAHVPAASPHGHDGRRRTRTRCVRRCTAAVLTEPHHH
mmetsp:Transcript_51497/g.171865  ORF Transcript_51497/g.171865 Transcript_51497/m.171865 type:complete len:214 (-) Transcript_51497:25-666(-)